WLSCPPFCRGPWRPVRRVRVLGWVSAVRSRSGSPKLCPRTCINCSSGASPSFVIHSITFSNRSKRRAVTQVIGLYHRNELPYDQNRILAGPIRFSLGTKPTVPRQSLLLSSIVPVVHFSSMPLYARLSFEPSRLSPIMK